VRLETQNSLVRCEERAAPEIPVAVDLKVTEIPPGEQFPARAWLVALPMVRPGCPDLFDLAGSLIQRRVGRMRVGRIGKRSVRIETAATPQL
jgi:hypothetical protein